MAHRARPGRGTAARAAAARGAIALAAALAALPSGAAEPGPPGDAGRGRELLLQRHETGCILCHRVAGIAAGGDLGPPLAGVGRRLDAAQLRARIADARAFNPATIMPPYRSSAGMQNVAPAYAGKPILGEQALDDIVAYLLAEPTPAARPPDPTRKDPDGPR